MKALSLKPLAALIGALLLSGCSASHLQGALGIAEGDYRGLVGVYPAEMAQIISDPTTRRMEMRAPQQGVAVMMLAAGESRGVIRWRGTDNAQIYTRDGMVIATRGLGADVMTVDSGAATALIREAAPGQIRRLHRILTANNQTEIRSWVCDIEPTEISEQVISSETDFVTARKITETCYGPRGGFTNDYWVNNGKIVKAWQHIDPVIGSLQLLFLR